MDVVVAFVSAMLGLSVAFFLSLSFYDLVPDARAWLRSLRRPSLDALGGRHPLVPRTHPPDTAELTRVGARRAWRPRQDSNLRPCA